MRVSFVIPALNEHDGIRVALESIPRGALRASGHDVEVLVVDGASTDGTAEEAVRLGARVLVEPRRGYGRAYKTGLTAARGDVIVTGDADGTYPFEDAPALLSRFESARLDFLTANRLAALGPGAMSRKHRFGNWVLSTTTRLLFGIRLRDSQSGMWLIRRRVVDDLPLESMSDGMPFSEELKIRAFKHGGLACLEVPSRYASRTGTPKLASWRDGMRNLRHLFALWFRRFRLGNRAH